MLAADALVTDPPRLDAPPTETQPRYVGKRLAATLLANGARSILALGSGILVARGLGATAYGDLMFLLGSFATVSLLTDLGTSTAFYTFLSRRKRGRTFFLLYSGWLFAQLLVPTAIIAAVLPENALRAAWIGHPRPLILLALAANFFTTQAWNAVTQLGEAARRTILVQTAATVPVVLHLLIIGAIVLWGHLTVNLVLWLLLAEYALASFVLVPRLLPDNLADGVEEDWRATVGAFRTYCQPLVLYGLVAFVYNFADRWLLQFFGGAAQQAYFSVGLQFSAVSLLATTSVVRVFWKELAEARELNDHARAKRLYDGATRSLLFVAALVSCFLVPFSADILRWTVGPGFESGALALAMLFIYPVYQTLGQIQGTFFFASSETKSYAKMGIIMMLVSLPLGYLLLASRSATVPGLGLGALGLAMKMVLVQVVTINAQAFIIGKRNGWSPAYAHQASVIVGLLGLAYVLRFGVTALLSAVGSSNPVMVFGLSGIVYLPITILLVHRVPTVVGLRGEELRQYYHAGMRVLGRS